LRAKSSLKKLGAMLAFRPRDFKPRIGVMLGLTDPVCGLNMGQTAEVLYRDYGITAKQQDAFALDSHQKVVKARAKLAEEIATVYLAKGQFVDKDNGVRENQTMEALAKLRPVFDKHNGTVTAGNSSQITDGAVALLVMEEEKARKQGFQRWATCAAMLSPEWTAADGDWAGVRNSEGIGGVWCEMEGHPSSLRSMKRSRCRCWRWSWCCARNSA